MSDHRRPSTDGTRPVDYNELLTLLNESLPVGNLPLPAGAPSPHQLSNATGTLFHLLALQTHPQGWLRLTASPDGQTLYYKFKWNKGKWRGYYEMSVVQHWQLCYGIALISHKVREVDEGLRKPAKDTAFDWRD